MKDAAPDLRQPRWQAVILVCKDCGKRSSGPKHLKPKVVASAVRADSKHAKTRTRVLMTNCMGLCPKSAVAVARVGSDGAQIVAIRSAKQIEDVVARLTSVPAAPAAESN